MTDLRLQQPLNTLSPITSKLAIISKDSKPEERNELFQIVFSFVFFENETDLRLLQQLNSFSPITTNFEDDKYKVCASSKGRMVDKLDWWWKITVLKKLFKPNEKISTDLTVSKLVNEFKWEVVHDHTVHSCRSKLLITLLCVNLLRILEIVCAWIIINSYIFLVGFYSYERKIGLNDLWWFVKCYNISFLRSFGDSLTIRYISHLLRKSPMEPLNERITC